MIPVNGIGERKAMNSNFLNHRIWFFPIILLAVILLAACKVGPNYQQPITKMPATWGALPADSANPSAAISGQPPVQNWWTTFKDRSES